MEPLPNVINNVRAALRLLRETGPCGIAGADANIERAQILLTLAIQALAGDDELPSVQRTAARGVPAAEQ